MTKLLQGKSLYIAKHMHNQALHADVDDHADPRPISRLEPCVSVITDDGLAIDRGFLKLRERPPGSRVWTAERIGYASLIFHDIPDIINDAYLQATVHIPNCTEDTHIRSFLQLATIHYAVVFVCLTLNLYWDFLHTPITSRRFWTGMVGVTHAPYSYTLDCDSDAGPFGASVKPTWYDFDRRSYTWGSFYCPKETILEVHEADVDMTLVLSVHRDAEGEYHFY